MTREILIDPVTRIEGHSRITIQLDDAGEVSDAHFAVTQFRGFEKLCQGRPFAEMPSLMARICGICPVSHLIASSKACDGILAVRPPKTGADLRTLMNLAQIVQSNALSLFHLSSPDLLFGFDADPATRNIVGVATFHPQLAKDGIFLRKFGQHTIFLLGSKRIHPSWIVPGGVETPLTADKRAEILAMMPEAYAAMQRAIDWFTGNLMPFVETTEVFGSFPSAFMAMVNDEGNVEHYDGKLRVVDAERKLIAEFDGQDYAQYIGEGVDDRSFLKPTYLKSLGPVNGVYRVGTLARAIVANAFGTPRADEALGAFRARFGIAPQSSFHYHYTRLLDVLYCIERMEQLLLQEDILSERVLAKAEVNSNVGIGVSEAPRGTLIHHYTVDDDGIIQTANLVIATGHNASAMNMSVRQVARRYVRGEVITEGMLNRVEAVIRCYDPCLSCSTHAMGQMPLHIELLSPDGTVLDEVRR